MTCLAWDGQTLAADKLACVGELKTTTTKIFRVGDCLAGVSGNLSVGMEVLDWFRQGADPAKYPSSNRPLNEGCSLLVVRHDRSVWRYESSPFPFRLEGRHIAAGCGAEAAMVAMACGRTAAEAVGLASMFNAGCGNGIDTLQLPQ